MTRDAYYKRLKRLRKQRIGEDVILKAVDAEREDEPRVGTRKLHDRLQKQGLFVGRDALFDLLRRFGKLVRPHRSYRKTTYSQHQYAVAPNRVKTLSVTAPEQVLVSDITYLELQGSKCAYLFLVTDLFSRKIVGYHLSKDLSHHSALIALDSAIESMREPHGAIHHSDRGCQYCCHEYLGFLGQNGMVPSMTDEAHCYQNAVAERVNGILKIDFCLDRSFESFQEMKRAVDKSILVYNTKRTHWSLNLRTPQEVYDLAA